MQGIKALAATLLACTCMLGHTGEVELRAQIKAQMQDAFARGDYKSIEGRYAAALAAGERTPSGLFVAEQIRQAVIAGPSGESDVAGRDDYWVPVERKLDDWAGQFPDSALVGIVQSWAYVGHGWSWRGGGFANTVPKEAFQKLGIYTEKAYEALMAREKAGRHRDPYWYVQMLHVARLQGWPREQFLAVFQEGSETFPLNYDIYFAASTQLVPRWGGSQQAIAALADYAARQTRETEGEAVYARIYWAVGNLIDTELGGPGVDWNRIRAGFDDIVRQYPDRWNLNHYARMACEAQDAPTARRVLLRIKGDVEPSAWAGRPAYLRCVDAAGLKREDLR